MAVGIDSSIIISANLNNRAAAAQKRGYEAGLARGYPVGFRDGSRRATRTPTVRRIIKGTTKDTRLGRGGLLKAQWGPELSFITPPTRRY